MCNLSMENIYSVPIAHEMPREGFRFDDKDANVNMTSFFFGFFFFIGSSDFS